MHSAHHNKVIYYVETRSRTLLYSGLNFLNMYKYF